MKTELIELLLNKSMIKFEQRRTDRHPLSCAVIQQRSEVESYETRDREVYTIGVTFESRFYRLAHEPDPVRTQRYHDALCALAEVMYGEIRREFYKLLPLTVDIDNREARETMEAVLNRIENMTRID